MQSLSKLETESRIRVLFENAYNRCKMNPNVEKDDQSEDSLYTKYVQMDSEVLDNEKKISEQIQQIPNYHLYFSCILQTEPLELSQISDNNIEKCNQSPNQNLNQPPNQNLVSIITRTIESTKTLKELYTSESESSQIESSTTLSNILLHEIKLLQTKNIVSMNITMDSVLYDTITGIPVLTDWSNAFQYNEEINPDNYFLPYVYESWPIEIYKKQTPEEIDEFLNESILKTLTTPEHYQQYEQELKAFFSNQNQNQNPLKYATTWDIYAVGVIMLQIHQIKPIDDLEKWKNIVYSTPDQRLQFIDLMTF